MHMIRLLATCALILLVADLLLLVQSSPSKRPSRGSRNSTTTTNGSAAVSTGQKNHNSNSSSNRVRQVTFGMISREEWLAKEYFGYLCASSECVTNDTKVAITDKCFDPHQKLKSLITACFGPDRKCGPNSEDKAMQCIVKESKSDPQLIPLTLHDCVDERITMKDWKCMRRNMMERLRNVMQVYGNKQTKHTGDDAFVTSTNVTIFDM